MAGSLTGQWKMNSDEMNALTEAAVEYPRERVEEERETVEEEREREEEERERVHEDDDRMRARDEDITDLKIITAELMGSSVELEATTARLADVTDQLRLELAEAKARLSQIESHRNLISAAATPADANLSYDGMTDVGNNKRQGTRVFKKSSPNGKITVYLGKRDFVDHITHVDPIDGVVLIDPEYLRDRKVYGHVLAAFRYGREDLDVLGLTFRKDLYLASEQIYPQQCTRPLTRLQERLIKKLGDNAFPFFFELPPHCPASVTLQPAPGDTGKPCGVDYELKTFVGDHADDKAHKRNSVRLAIRKIMYAPSKPGEQPSVEASKDFMMSPNKLNLEASLDKDLYYHGEPINVNVHVQNNSTKTVKKLRVSVRQFADICLFSTAQYKCTVAETESEEGCPVGPGFTLSKVYTLTPLLALNKDKYGLALDGQLKCEDTNLASTTVVSENTPRESLGIIVKYKVKVRLILGALAGELTAELPFTLMHPKPEEEDPLSSIPPSNASPVPDGGATPGDAADTNLIQLEDTGDTGTADDDLIFEDFARLRLKAGETEA